MKILVLLLIAAIVSELTRGFLARAARRYSPGRHGGVVLKYSDTLKLAAVVFPSVVFLMLAVGLLNANLASPESQILLLSLILIIVPIGIAVVLEVFFKQVLLDDEGIRLLGIFGGGAVAWKEIESVSYNRWLKMFTIHAWGGGCLRINPSLSGIGLLESSLWRQVEKARFRQALSGFRLVEQDLR